MSAVKKLISKNDLSIKISKIIDIILNKIKKKIFFFDMLKISLEAKEVK